MAQQTRASVVAQGVPSPLGVGGVSSRVRQGVLIPALGYAVGYSDGYTAGHAAGYTAGYSAGYTAGYAAGQTAGYATGYAAGYTAGQTAGYATGYTAGYAAGFGTGYATASQRARPVWKVNEADASRRTVGMYITESDGVTPAPHATSFAGHIKIRQGGTTVAAASGTLTNIGGYDGLFVYTATQAETNIDGFEFEVFIDWSGSYSYSSATAHMISSGWSRNQSDAAKRAVAMTIYENDGATLAPSGTSFTGHVKVRQGGSTVAAAGGTLVNIGGYAGKFLYTATQAETNYDGDEFQVFIDWSGSYEYSPSTIGLVQAGSAPAIAIISPEPSTTPGQPGGFSASYETARVTPIVFTVETSDPSLSIAYLVASVSYVTGDAGAIGYRQSSAAIGAFSTGFVLNSSASLATNGVELTIAPDAGWPTTDDATALGYIVLEVTAVDSGGNSVDTTYVFELPPNNLTATAPIPFVPAGAFDQTSAALGRIREQFRSKDYIPTPFAAAVPASKTITSTGAQLVITALVAGSNGNNIELANDALGGVFPPTETDDGLIVSLNSNSAATFQDVADAINASSELVSAVALGDGDLSFASVTIAFSGNLSGGTDAL